jgi:hypothetical protein
MTDPKMTAKIRMTIVPHVILLDFIAAAAGRQFAAAAW